MPRAKSRRLRRLLAGSTGPSSRCNRRCRFCVRIRNGSASSLRGSIRQTADRGGRLGKKPSSARAASNSSSQSSSSTSSEYYAAARTSEPKTVFCSLLAELLECHVDEERAVKLGGFAPTLSGDGQEARGERLVPFDREAGHVRDDQGELIGSGVARQWDGVQPGAAHGGVGEQRVHGNASLGPALREARVFEDRQHQPGVAGLLHFHILYGGGDGGCCGQRAAHAEGLLGQVFDGHADRGVFCRRGRGGKIDAHVGPAALRVHAPGVVLDVEGHGRERIGEALAGRGEVRRVLERGGHDGGRLQRNGELVAETGVVGGGKKRRQRGHIGNGGKRKLPWLCSVEVSSFFMTRAAAAIAPQRTPSSPATTRLAFRFFVLARISASMSACEAGSLAFSMAGPMDMANFCCSARASTSLKNATACSVFIP